MPDKIEIAFDRKSTRLVFKGMGQHLIINPRPAKCEFQFDPNAGNYSCAECDKSGFDDDHHEECWGASGGPLRIPLERVIDEYADSESPWFAFWEEDCFEPPIWIVRAESFEQAYEDFVDALPAADLEDLDEDQRAMVEGGGNLPDGYTFDSQGALKHTETIQGREIELIEVTCE